MIGGEADVVKPPGRAMRAAFDAAATTDGSSIARVRSVQGMAPAAPTGRWFARRAWWS